MLKYWPILLLPFVAVLLYAGPQETSPKAPEKSPPAREHRAVHPEKRVPHYTDFDLSDRAAAAFLNDPEVIEAYETADFFSADQTFHKRAVRLIERKALHYKIALPKDTTDAPAPRAPKPRP